MRTNRLMLLLPLLVPMLGWVGCSKSAPDAEAAGAGNPKGPAAATLSNAPSGETISRIHWLGKRRIAADTNSAYLMTVWGLPESSRLEAQVLDKLALAPGRWLKGNHATNNSQAVRLRPLLADLLQEEFHLTIKHRTNAASEFALAVRLNQLQAEAWRTNLSLVVESLTGTQPAARPNGWSLKNSQLLGTIELSREDDWEILHWGGEPASGDRVASARKPPQREQSGTQPWLEADFPFARVMQTVLPKSDGSRGGSGPSCSVAISGDGENVRIKGELRFPDSIRLGLEPWTIPTNWIKEPVVSFSAIRGIQQLLQPFTSQADLGTAPNQAYGWSYPGVPYQTYFAAPWPDASNRIAKVSDNYVNQGNAWLATNAMGKLTQSNKDNLLSWIEIPFLTPDLKAARIGEAEFLLGSFFPNRSNRTPAPNSLLEQLYGKTNTVYYAWEITQERIGGWTDIGQLLRIALNKPQLPPKSRSMDFLVAAAPRLGNCVTAAYLTDANRISFVRKSSIGLTGLELHLLADWFESPEFPDGIHTLAAQPTPAAHKAKNSPPTP
jgi:hypothetical protein